MRSAETSAKEMRRELDAVPVALARSQQEAMVSRLKYQIDDISHKYMHECAQHADRVPQFADVFAVCTAMLDATDRGLNTVENALHEYGRKRTAHKQYENLFQKFMRERQAAVAAERERYQSSQSGHVGHNHASPAVEEPGYVTPKKVSKLNVQQKVHPEAQAHHAPHMDEDELDLGRTPTLDDLGLSSATLAVLQSNPQTTMSSPVHKLSLSPDMSPAARLPKSSRQEAQQFDVRPVAQASQPRPPSTFTSALPAKGPAPSATGGYASARPAVARNTEDLIMAQAHSSSIVPSEPVASATVAASSQSSTVISKLLINRVEEEEYASAPIFLRTQLALPALNSLVDTINMHLNQKIASNPVMDWVSQTEMENDLAVGSKTKALILLMRHLKRFDQKKVDGEFVYCALNCA